MSDKRRKLSKSQQAEIVAKYATGEHTQADLALEYDVTPNTIGRVIKKAREAELLAVLRRLSAQ